MRWFSKQNPVKWSAADYTHMGDAKHSTHSKTVSNSEFFFKQKTSLKNISFFPIFKKY